VEAHLNGTTREFELIGAELRAQMEAMWKRT
jgi:hypothetical protein